MKRLLLVLSTIAILLCLSVMPAFADNENGLPAVPDPIDPQSWMLHRDMTWDDLKPNPVANWMDELNPASLRNPKAAGSTDPITGGLILIEYLDKKFVLTEPQNSSSLGFYLSGQDKISPNPQIHVDREDLVQWWGDFLNKPQDINHGLSIDGFWRENSYGKWAINFDVYGPFTIPYFEFETMGYDINSNFQTYKDIPPSFRYGDPEAIRATVKENNPTWTEAQVGTEVERLIRLYNSSTTTTGQNANPYFSLNQGRRFDRFSIAFGRDNGVPYGNFDFFFMLHAGYDESGVWLPFGQGQFRSRAEVPYELGPGPRLAQVEQIFTENPALLDTYVARYPDQQVFKEAAALRDELVAAGKLDEFVFKLPQADWDWANGYNTQPDKNTRYVPFTSWQAAVGEWSHMSSAGTDLTGAGRSIQYSTQGENDGMATFAHEFGHIGGMNDNYHNAWESAFSPDAMPWDLMAAGSLAGPYGDHTRWSVPGIEGGTVPSHLMLSSKKMVNYYDEGDLLSVNVQDLATATPLVAEVVGRNVPFDTQYNNFGLPRGEFVKGIELNFGSGTWADQAVLQTTGWTWTRWRASRIGIEVVDKTGYDSFAHDHGVIISRINSSGQGRSIIDSHLYDLEMVDYYVNGLPTKYPIAHQSQLADAAFHAGVSYIDTGYYKGGTSRGDKSASEDVVSGHTVNEFHDPYNKLRFYILDKHMNEARYGEFLSYEIGILHEDGVAVGGELVVEPGELIAAIPDLVAQQDFTITNTGDATDIVRVSVNDINFPVTLLNNLYAIEPGETITVPVYVEIPFETDVDNMQGQSLIFTASSESNATKVGTAAISTFDLVVGGKGNLRLVTDAHLIKGGDYFRANAYFREAVDSNTATVEFIFDTTQFLYRGFTPAKGVEVLNTVTTETGVKFTLMKQDYATKSFGEVLFSAKEDINMESEDNEIKVIVDYVTRVDGEKIVKSEVASTCFMTDVRVSPGPLYSLVMLSNLIDIFGMKYTHADWNIYRYYDYNNNRMIDIYDICKFASMIE